MEPISMKQLIALAYRGVEALEEENARTKQQLAAMMSQILAEEQKAKDAQASETLNTAENIANNTKESGTQESVKKK